MVFLQRHREVVRMVDAYAGPKDWPLEIGIRPTGLDYLTNVADRACDG